MKPETKRRLINGVISVVVIAGLLRFFSGELSRKDSIHEKERSALLVTITDERKRVESLKEQVKSLKEKVRIVRTKDADGNEKEIIERDTQSDEKTTEHQIVVSELKSTIKQLEQEKEYIRETSTPIGQIGIGTSHSMDTYYFRAGYAVFGPLGIEFVVSTEPQYLAGITWTF